MEHITIKEYAKLRGCSEQNVRKMIADGQLAYELSGNANRNQTKYLIPVSELRTGCKRSTTAQKPEAQPLW